MSVYIDWIEKRVPSSNFKASSRKDYISRFNTYVKLNSKLERHKKLYRLEADVFKLFKSEYKDITKDDYISIHNAVSKNSKTQANRLIEDMRLVEQYAIEIGVLEKEFVSSVRKNLTKKTVGLIKMILTTF